MQAAIIKRWWTNVEDLKQAQVRRMIFQLLLWRRKAKIHRAERDSCCDDEVQTCLYALKSTCFREWTRHNCFVKLISRVYVKMSGIVLGHLLLISFTAWHALRTSTRDEPCLFASNAQRYVDIQDQLASVTCRLCKECFQRWLILLLLTCNNTRADAIVLRRTRRLSAVILLNLRQLLNRKKRRKQMQASNSLTRAASSLLVPIMNSFSRHRRSSFSARLSNTFSLRRSSLIVSLWTHRCESSSNPASTSSLPAVSRGRPERCARDVCCNGDGPSSSTLHLVSLLSMCTSYVRCQVTVSPCLLQVNQLLEGINVAFRGIPEDSPGSACLVRPCRSKLQLCILLAPVMLHSCLTAITTCSPLHPVPHAFAEKVALQKCEKELALLKVQCKILRSQHGKEKKPAKG